MKLRNHSLLILLGTLGLFWGSSEWTTATAILVAQTSTPIPALSQSTPEKPTTTQPAPEKPAEQAVPTQSVPEKPAPESTPQQVVDPYSSLKQALSQGKLKVADQITYELMLEMAGPKSQQEGRFEGKEWGKFSCSSLREIDQIWQEATKGTQGFGVQKEIFVAEKNGLAYQKKVGWKDASGKWIVTPRYDPTKKFVYYEKEPNFKNPPRGHLPAKLAWWDAKDRRFEKINACGL